MKLHHINIKAPEELLIQEKDFFCNVIGLTIGHRPIFKSKGYWLYSGENALVHLTIKDINFSQKNRSHFDHVAFQSSNLKAFLNKLAALDIEFSQVYLEEINMTQVFLNSPLDVGVEVNFINER